MALVPQRLDAINTSAYQYNKGGNFTNFIDLITKDSISELPEYTDKRATVFQQYADWAAKNPIVFETYLNTWFASFKNEVTDLFPTTLSDSETFVVESVNFGDFTLEQMSRNAPARHVHSTKTTKIVHSLYTGLGAEFDYYHTKTKDGPAEWDLKLNVIRGSLVAFDLVVCLNRFLTDYNSYNNDPNMQYPGHPKPAGMEGVFRYMRDNLFPVIKSKYATTDIIKRMDKMFAARSGVTAMKRNLQKLLMSSHDMFYLLNNSRMLSLFSESGAASLGYELQMTMSKTVANVDLVSFPFVQRYSHNKTDSIANKHIIANGTWYVWRDPNHAIALEDMRSRYRNVSIFNYRNNDFTKYSYREFVKACTDYKRDGSVNWEMKDMLSQESVSEADNSFLRKCGCKNSEEIRRHLDWSLVYRPQGRIRQETMKHDGVNRGLNPQYDTKAHRHLMHVGEFPEYFLKEEYLHRMAEKLRLVVFLGDGDDDSFDNAYVTKLINTSDLLRRLPRQFVLNFIIDRPGIHRYSLASKLFGHQYYNAADLVRSKLTVLLLGIPHNVDDLIVSDLDHALIVNVNALVRAPINGDYFGNTDADPTIDYFTTHGNPFETYDEQTRMISRLDYLYMKSYTKPPQVGAALRLFILLGNNTQMVDCLSSRDVPIPLGGAMERHLETQWSSSFWGISDKNLGKRFQQPASAMVSFDTNVQKYKLGTNYQVAYVLDDPDKWMSYDNVIPGPYISGKGDGFITDLDADENTDPNVRVSGAVKEAYVNGNPIMLKGYDWNPFMTSYNSTVEENRSAIDVRGYFSVDLVLGKLDPDNADFTRTRDRAMYPGVFWNNYMFNFKSASYNINADEIPRFSQISRLQMQQFNTICQPATFERVDPVSRKKRVYNGTVQTAYHMMGPQVPGRFQLETGLKTLSAYEEC
jgi:hypothetical protein